MTTFTNQTTKIGTLQGLNGVAVIYQTESEFFYQSSGWTMNEKGDEIDIERTSPRYPSLERLLAPFPRGIHFQREGEIESREAYIKRVSELIEPPGSWERRSREIDDEFIAEYGTTDYDEIAAIVETRKKNGTYVPPPPKKQPDPEQMIKIGILQGQSGKGTIYQDGPDFLYLSSGWTQSEIDDGIYIDEKSERFPTLNTLLATIPRGIEYHPEEK